MPRTDSWRLAVAVDADKGTDSAPQCLEILVTRFCNVPVAPADLEDVWRHLSSLVPKLPIRGPIEGGSMPRIILSHVGMAPWPKPVPRIPDRRDRCLPADPAFVQGFH